MRNCVKSAILLKLSLMLVTFTCPIIILANSHTHRDEYPTLTVNKIHVVKWHESLDVISQIYGTSVEKIMSVNNLTTNKLKVKQKLIIPIQAAPGDVIYTVKNGDSFYSIAKKHAISAKELMDYNFITSPNIKLGDQLRIPVKGTQGKPNSQVVQVSIDDDMQDVGQEKDIVSFSPNNREVQNNISISDVDVNIPVSRRNQNNTFALIIANENYKRESNVPYAINDGSVFRKYCLETIGIPQSNVHYIEDATLNDIRAELNWIRKVSEVYGGDASLIIYYAGHGIPDERTKESYILPVDAYGSDITTAYSLQTLYSTLSEFPTKSTVVFLDACFSGSQRSGEMLDSSRGVAIKAKPNTPIGNMVVFSASTGDETAFPYTDQSHGMFTYFLLKKLQETGGLVSLGELADYIKTNVSRKAIVENLKSQTPTIVTSDEINETWTKWKL